MGGRLPLLFISAAIYLLCVNLPVIVVEQITGLWSVYERAFEDYLLIIPNPSEAALEEWALAYSGKVNLSFASFIFLLLIPGPLTLGLSSIWLLIIRGKDAYSDMIFSGFTNFLRVAVMDTLRRLFMILWAILFFIPGVIAYYRYSLTFFLLADNPSMKPFEALSYSRYYMQFNKKSRFYLDLSFVGWLALSVLVLILAYNGIISVMIEANGNPSLFTQYFVMTILSSLIMAPVTAYRGIAAAEYYHRVICRDPSGLPELPILTR